MKPSTAGSGACPARHAASARAITSAGCSIFVFRANESSEWNRRGAWVLIASWYWPNQGNACSPKASRSASASSRSSGQRSASACGAPKLATPAASMVCHRGR